jgi:uncharacterized protein
MRIVADSNILLSAMITEGPAFEVVNLILGGQVDPVFSRETFGELADVLMTREPFDRISRELRGAYLGHLSERGTWRRPMDQPVKCRDPGDQPFLDLAVASAADYLVTRDDDLLEISEVGAMKIRTPEDFLREFRTSGSGR